MVLKFMLIRHRQWADDRQLMLPGHALISRACIFGVMTRLLDVVFLSLALWNQKSNMLALYAIHYSP